MSFILICIHYFFFRGDAPFACVKKIKRKKKKVEKKCNRDTLIFSIMKNTLQSQVALND